jgi:hypothetical protein
MISVCFSLVCGGEVVAAGENITASGLHKGDTIYYIGLGPEEGITERGENDIYLIGGDRRFQANVVEYIPGEQGYTPHWNANLVKTAPGITVDVIAVSPFASVRYPEALFDDVEDILGAEGAGLVTVERLGVVLLCPIIPEMGSGAPGHNELPDEFNPWEMTF